MRIELFLALRLMRQARTQSLLIALGAAVGVAVIVFLSALIGGLQVDLIARTLGSQAHVVLAPAVEQPRPQWRSQLGSGVMIASEVELSDRRVRTILEGDKLLARVRQEPEVVSAAGICAGAALSQRGSAERTVSLLGVLPADFAKVVPLADRLIAGSLQIAPREALIGYELAEALGVTVSDRLRVRTAREVTALLTVRGILRFDVQSVDERWLVVPLSDAQALLGLPGGLTRIELTVRDIYAAEAVADRLRTLTQLDAVSWMESNRQLLSGLRSQSGSSDLIKTFVLIAVAIGIASALVVAVVQRQRDIGILRAMGLSRGTTQRIFLIWGGLLGLLGACLGNGLGFALCQAFMAFARKSPDGPRFSLALTPGLILGAAALSVVTGLLSASLPARKAARMLPVTAIRNE